MTTVALKITALVFKNIRTYAHCDADPFFVIQVTDLQAMLYSMG